MPSKHARCGWARFGLGFWVERCCSGPPGQMRFDNWSFDADGARLVVAQRAHALTNIVHRASRILEGTVRDDMAFDHAAMHMLVAWMLDGPEPGTRQGFHRLLVDALRGQKIDSSVALDRALGRTIESCEQPWRQWLADRLVASR